MLGVHVIADLKSCNHELLNDPKFIEDTLRAATQAAGATEIHTTVHTFNPVGVTGVTVLAESHISIHTWPDKGYATVDAFTCGDKAKPHKAIAYIKTALRGLYDNYRVLSRGQDQDFNTSAHFT